MRYWYDTEFLEHNDGRIIDPISIGVVSEDGREFYAVFSDLPVDLIKDPETKAHGFLTREVVPSLPIIGLPHEDWTLNRADESVMSIVDIRRELVAFLTDNDDSRNGFFPEWWSYFGTCDHRVYTQIFGRFMDVPLALPWKTYDIIQFEADLRRRGVLRPRYRMPGQPKHGAHHALVDARWHKAMYDDLIARERKYNGHQIRSGWDDIDRTGG